MICRWGKYLAFIKVLTVNNNSLPLIEIFSLIKSFTVNNNYLPLIKLYFINKTISRS